MTYMDKFKVFFSLLLIQSAFAITILTSSHAADAFPFRAVSVGEKVPPFTLTSLEGKNLPSGQLKGQPAILIFWGADMPTKKQRSIKALRALEELKPFLEKKNVRLLSVDIQEDPENVIQEVKTGAGSSVPVYLDSNKEAYKALGIFVMPSVLVVDKKGIVAAGMGYSHDLIPRLKGEIEILLGEKTREQVEEELHPKTIKKSEEETAALRHFNMGLVMARRGMMDSAIDEIKKAIELDHDMAEAYIELGCLYVDSGKIEEGEKELEKGLDLAPNSVKGQICMAKVKAQTGNIDEGISDIMGLMFRNAGNPEIHYVLGCLYAQKGDDAKAAREFKKAYELLKKLKAQR